jgi:N-acetylglucosamine-6-sulfatase
MDSTSHQPSHFLSIVSALAVAGCAAAAGLDVGSPAPAHGKSPSRPNIVVVMTDDQTVADLRDMPRTRRLVERRGVRFDRSYVSYPVCCPSRATFQTGQYAHNHGVMGLYAPTGGYGRLDKHNTLPVWLERAGYYTTHLGKFLNGYGDQEPADVPPGWSEWHATVDYSTYRMWGYRLNDNGRIRTYGRPFRQDPRLYQTDVLTRKALRAMKNAGRRPFFVSLNYLAPHHEDRRVQRRTGKSVRPAPRHARAYASASIRRTPSFNESDMSDKPRYLRRHTRPLTRRHIARITRTQRSRRAALLAVDDGIGRIVSALRRRGQLGNTYVVVTSDNGYMQGEHRVRSGKLLPYEPSTRVPLLISGPGLPRGRRSSELVANVDLAPTLVAIAGARAGRVMDGRSLLPFAGNPGRRTRRAILHETGGALHAGPRAQDEAANRAQALKTVLTYQGIRTRRWLYVRYRDGSRELYDMRRDPNQLNSLHANPRYRRTMGKLGRQLRRLAHCRGAGCRRPAVTGVARASGPSGWERGACCGQQAKGQGHTGTGGHAGVERDVDAGRAGERGQRSAGEHRGDRGGGVAADRHGGRHQDSEHEQASKPLDSHGDGGGQEQEQDQPEPRRVDAEGRGSRGVERQRRQRAVDGRQQHAAEQE